MSESKKYEKESEASGVPNVRPQMEDLELEVPNVEEQMERTPEPEVPDEEGQLENLEVNAPDDGQVENLEVNAPNVDPQVEIQLIVPDVEPQGENQVNSPNVALQAENLQANVSNVGKQLINPEPGTSHVGAQDYQEIAPYARALVEDVQFVENADIRYGSVPSETVPPEVQAHLQKKPLFLVRNFRRIRMAAMRRQETRDMMLEAKERGEVVDVDRLAALMRRVTLLGRRHFYRNFALCRARASHERVSRRMTANFNSWAHRWQLSNIDTPAKFNWKTKLFQDDASYKVEAELVESSSKAPYFSYKKYVLKERKSQPEVEDLSSQPSTSSQVLERRLPKSRKGAAVKNRRTPAHYESSKYSDNLASGSGMDTSVSKSSKGKCEKGSPAVKSTRVTRSSRRQQNTDQDESKTDESNKSKDRSSPPNGSPTKKMKF